MQRVLNCFSKTALDGNQFWCIRLECGHQCQRVKRLRSGRGKDYPAPRRLRCRECERGRS
jgi:hypothetical protein